MGVIFPEWVVLLNHLTAVSVLGLLTIVQAGNPKAGRAPTAVIAVDGLPESCLVKPFQQTMQQAHTHHIVEVHGVDALVSFCVQDIVHGDHPLLPAAQIFPQRLDPHKTASPGVEALDGERRVGVGRLYPAFRVALVTGFISCLIKRGSREEKENKHMSLGKSLSHTDIRTISSHNAYI